MTQIANMICGDAEPEQTNYFRYRSSSFQTELFQDCDTDYKHDGSTRRIWVADTLRAILATPQPNAQTPPEPFSRAVRTLMDQGDATSEPTYRRTY